MKNQIRYSPEIKEREGSYLVGDKLYGMSTQILKEIIKRSWIPVIKVEESLHKGIKIKEGIRKLAAKSYNDHLDIYKEALSHRVFYRHD